MGGSGALRMTKEGCAVVKDFHINYFTRNGENVQFLWVCVCLLGYLCVCVYV